MRLKIFILMFLAAASLLSACQKDVDTFVPDPTIPNGPDTAWQAAITPNMPVSLLKNSLIVENYVDSFEVNASIATVTTPSGLQVIFPPHCCINGAGQPVTGRVEVELVQVKKKGDMIRMGMPTTYGDSLLIAAGNIFIRLKKNGQMLQLAPNVKLYIRYFDQPVSSSMKLFIGDESAQNFNWLPNPDVLNNTVSTAAQAYEVYSNRQRWISIAYGYDFSNTPQVNIVAGLANYFTNANTIAFTVLKDFRSVVAMHGNLSNRKFIAAKLPAGKIVTVVVISKLGGNYYLGYESALVTAPTSSPANQTVNVVPIKKSLPEILSYLNSL